MKLQSVTIVGGGPAGLYLAYLLKSRGTARSVTVFEQNARGATYGFGVSMTERILSYFQGVDEQSFDRIARSMWPLRKQILFHPDGEVLLRDSRDAGAFDRVKLLEALACSAEESGVTIEHERRVEDLSFGEAADLVVGADGANSVVRSLMEPEFQTRTHYLTNRFAWFGTRRVFPGSGLRFIAGSEGNWVGHFYPYTSDMSTFVVECDEQTWEEKLAGKGSLERRSFAEKIFEEDLDGEGLIDSNSQWRCFRVVENDRWCYGNHVLIGDALFTAHFSIGSGTRLALEDAVALADTLERSSDSVSQTLGQFARERKEAKNRLINACRGSWDWYERFAEKVASLSPVEFAYDYMMRTGRMDDRKLEAISPDLMRAYRNLRHGRSDQNRRSCENARK